jgi:hypothetical protein
MILWDVSRERLTSSVQGRAIPEFSAQRRTSPLDIVMAE